MSAENGERITNALSDFLLHRLDEDAADACSCCDYGPGSWSYEMLRRAEAGRRIVEDCAETFSWTEKSSAPILADRILKHLATAYADHPDYQEEWTP